MRMRCIALFWVVLIMAPLVNAATTVLPPSVALRTEVSYVSVVLLTSITAVDGDLTDLSFQLIENLHNDSSENISIKVPNFLAAQLEIDAEYVIAYETVKKIRDNESKRYVFLSDGPKLMRVQGAYPAIFKRDASLIKQLTRSPALTEPNIQAFISDIFAGMETDDPGLKSFFVREIVNWPALHKYLTQQHYQKLYTALISPNANAGAKTAILEFRTNLHKGIGIERIGEHAASIIGNQSVILDPLGENSALVLHALRFLEQYEMSDWDMISRWTRTNIPTIAEQALLILKAIDGPRLQALAQQRLSETLMSESTRRVLKRFSGVQR